MKLSSALFNFTGFVSPFKIALEYIETGDVSILECLQQEAQDFLVLDIAEQAKDGK